MDNPDLGIEPVMPVLGTGPAKAAAKRQRAPPKSVVLIQPVGLRVHAAYSLCARCWLPMRPSHAAAILPPLTMPRRPASTVIPPNMDYSLFCLPGTIIPCFIASA
jgi:hypothetical protein